MKETVTIVINQAVTRPNRHLSRIRMVKSEIREILSRVAMDEFNCRYATRSLSFEAHLPGLEAGLN